MESKKINSPLTIFSDGFLHLHHVAIVVKDIEASILWYKEYLGFEKQYDFELPGAYATMMVLGNARLEFYQVKGALPVARERQEVDTVLQAEGVNHFAFTVADVNAAVDALQAKGVEVAVPPTNVPNGSNDRFAFIYDNNRMLVELLQPGKNK
jgi:catechol 2,3-dioxygenase-like lactoylglutathione lyase family enzyme